MKVGLKKMGESADSGGYRGISKGELRGGGGPRGRVLGYKAVGRLLEKEQ